MEVESKKTFEEQETLPYDGYDYGMSPVRPMMDLSTADEELIIEEESEEEAQTSDEEVLPICIHDLAPIEIDDDEVSVLSPSKPRNSEHPSSEGPLPPPAAEPPLDDSQFDPRSSPPSGGMEESQKDETMQSSKPDMDVEVLMDSDDEGGKENDKSRGTFKVGAHLQHHW